MKNKRRNHTAQFKAKVALAAAKGDKTIAEGYLYNSCFGELKVSACPALTGLVRGYFLSSGSGKLRGDDQKKFSVGHFLFLLGCVVAIFLRTMTFFLVFLRGLRGLKSCHPV